MDEEKEKKEEEKKELEVISGDGTGLEISPAYEHLNDATPEDTTENRPKNIIVPKEMSIEKINKEEKNKEDSEDEEVDEN